MPVAELAEVWERYAQGRTPRRDRNTAGATTWINWTGHPDHGPDETILGPVAGRTVLELGSGTGCNLAHLATLGADCTGVDISPTQCDKARTRWGHLPHLAFQQADVVDYLTGTDQTFDVIYSIFGPVWFTNPDALLPLILKRLAPNGLLAFSHTHPDDTTPQPARARFPRYDLSGEQWMELLAAQGFRDPMVDVIAPPDGSGTRALLVRSRAA